MRTNFTIPDVHSIALGGGSIIRSFPIGDQVSVGPDSVGARLDVESISFGGRTLTVSCTMVLFYPILILKANDLIIGTNEELVPTALKEAALGEILRTLEEAIDFVKTKQGDAKLILVGGGSVIIRDKIAGVGEIMRPKYLEVANAVGAAVSNAPIRI